PACFETPTSFPQHLNSICHPSLCRLLPPQSTRRRLRYSSRPNSVLAPPCTSSSCASQQERNPPSLPPLTLRSALYAQVRRLGLLRSKPSLCPHPPPSTPKRSKAPTSRQRSTPPPSFRSPRPAPTIPKKRRRWSCASA
ncbi:hypothetical protein C8J57DRAFT_1731237, partial [Mycena rebaudengoi]